MNTRIGIDSNVYLKDPRVNYYNDEIKIGGIVS